MSQQMSSNSQKNAQLWQAYQDKKANDRWLFPTEGAKALGVSEFELLLASPYSVYMGSDCKAVLEQFESFGLLESIVRNELAVHEKQGHYENLKLGDKMGLALNVGGLDLRFFMSRWRHMLAVTDESKADKPSYSIQFFDGRGNAISKVFLRKLSEQNIKRWQALIEQHVTHVTASNHHTSVSNDTDADTDADISNNTGTNTGTDNGVLNPLSQLEPLEQKSQWQYKALSEQDLQTLQQQWLEITDVHQFHFLLEKLGIDRASSFRQAPEGMACQLDIHACEKLFEKVRDIGCPIMIFVGNTGVVQIQTGQVYELKRIGDWFNILDKAQTQFTLHLKDKALAQLWCVKRPTKDGIVTCVEGFDETGSSVFTVFGQRLEGQPELPDWQQVTNELMVEFAVL